MSEYNTTFENVSARRFTDRTIEKMYELTELAKHSREIQDEARKVVRHCPWKDYKCFGEELLKHVKRKISYVKDPIGIERLQDPRYTLDIATGDCDDFSILLGALASSVGLDYEFVTIKARKDPRTGKLKDEWSHVFVAIKLPDGKWYAADAIVAGSKFGWYAKGYETKFWKRPKMSYSAVGELGISEEAKELKRERRKERRIKRLAERKRIARIARREALKIIQRRAKRRKQLIELKASKAVEEVATGEEDQFTLDKMFEYARGLLSAESEARLREGVSEEVVDIVADEVVDEDEIVSVVEEEEPPKKKKKISPLLIGGAIVLGLFLLPKLIKR